MVDYTKRNVVNGKLISSKKKRSRSKAKKTTPAVRYLRYEVTNSASPGTETSHFIDLARDISAINRRFYRQGRDYHVKRVTVVSSNTIAGFDREYVEGLFGATPQDFTQNAGRISFSTLPDSWMVRSAWKRGFDAWNQMNAQATKMGLTIKPTYHDFKIRGMGSYAQSPTYLVPKDNGGNALSLGEWTYSDLVSPDGTTGADEMKMHMLGDHIGAAGSRTSISLLKSYAETRATVDNNDPNMVINQDDPLLNLLDHGTTHDEIIENLETYGEDPPYNVLDYTGESGNMPQPLVVQDTTLGVDGKATVGGFNAICGLVEIECKSPIPSDVYSILVELAPGSYRGVKAEVI